MMHFLTAFFKYCLLGLILTTIHLSALAQSSLTLSPTADAFVRNGTYASSNFGSDTSLTVKSSKSNGYTRYAFLKFSLGNISSVSSAKLRIYGRNTENTITIPVVAYGVNDDWWTESGVTWNNKPTAITSALNKVGVNNTAQYYEIDVTAYIKAQISSDDKVVSLMLKDSANIDKSAIFNSKENKGNPPQLLLTGVTTTPASNALLFVENLDKFPSNDRFVASRIQVPWSRDKVNYNANHDTARIRIHNKGVNPLVISTFILSNKTAWKFLKLKGIAYDSATAFPLTIKAGTYADLTLQFIYNDSVSTSRVKLFTDNLTIVSNDDKFPKKVLTLSGIWQRKGEGGNEPYAQEIITAFGFKTKTGFSHTDPDQGNAGKPKGNEILSSYFVRADTTKPVTVRQMSAYHSCCTFTETIRWYTKGTTTYNSILIHKGVDGQTILPRKGLPNTPADGSFTPTGTFGFKVGAQDYSDTLLNPNRKIGIRIWKAIDENGLLIPNSYIISNDYLGTEFTNFDYNDNTYFITNVRPEIGTAYYSELSSTPSAVDFGEKLLQSSNAFALRIRNLGKTYTNGSSDPAISISSIVIVGENASEFSAVMPTKTTLNAQDTTTIAITFNPRSEGLKIADLLIHYNNSKSPYRVPLYGIGKANGTTVTAVYRIKAGSSKSMTINGKTWSADTLYAFDNLEPYSNPQVNSIAATDEDLLYTKEQSSNADKKPFRYELPIANGNYVVRLHFAEIYWGNPGAGLNGGPGNRVMSVSLENQMRLINLDVAAEVGPAAALIKNLPVTVTDGKLNINFSATVNRPMVMAIEVYRFSSGTTITEIDENSSVADASNVLKVYPNPLNQKFFIQFPAAYKRGVSLQLIDAAGRVYRISDSKLQVGGTTMEVDVSRWHLKPGIYFLRIDAEERAPEIVKLLIE